MTTEAQVNRCLNRYQAALQNRSEQQLLRQLSPIVTGIDFCSNDYLGFAKNHQLIEAIKVEAEQYCSIQTGATGSRLLSGNNPYIEETEQAIADFHGVEAALLFNSGYTANVGLLSCIASAEETLIIDELIHASLIDGARLSKAKKVRFKHNNLNDLSKKIASIQGEKIVVVESVYSMDGDLCPLKEIADLCKKANAKLIVDEAHGIGVLGETGEGLCGHLGIEKEVFATVVTYGKAMGCHGAAVLGKQWLKDYLVNFSRPFIFTTGPSSHQVAAIRATYPFLEKANPERKQLHQLIDYFIQKRQDHTFEWIPSNTQIQAVLIPGNDAVMKATNCLQAKGIDAKGIRYPSVSKGEERIRICLHSYNTKAEVDYLMEQLSLITR